MAVNEAKYRELLHGGVGHDAALLLADPDKDAVSGVAVADAAAITSTAPSAAYVQAEATAVRDDVVALHAKINALLASLRGSGVVSP